MRICIYGASSASLDEIYYQQAELLGKLIAEKGYGLVFGGGTNGLMGATARGVESVGGEIIGIAPKFFDEPGVLFENCTEMIFTETMRERKALLESKSDAVIVLPGGIGTYEEFFEILTLKQLGQSSRAIVIFNINNYYEPMQKLLEATANEKFMSSNCLELYKVVNTPEDALHYIENYIPESGSIHRLEDYSK